MKLILESWRRYLNEVTFQQASRRSYSLSTGTGAVLKLVKSQLWKFSQHAKETSQFKVYEGILNNKKYTEILSFLVFLPFYNTIRPLDLNDNQKGTALNWLISTVKKDERVAMRVVAQTQKMFLSGMKAEYNMGYQSDRWKIRADNEIAAYKIFEETFDIIKMKPEEINNLSKNEMSPELKKLQGVYKGYKSAGGGLSFRSYVIRFVLQDIHPHLITNTLDSASYHGMTGFNLRATLERFFHYQQFMIEKDLYKLKTLQDLKREVDEADEKIKAHQEKQLYLDAEEGTEVFRDDDIFIAALHNKGAACELGKETDWCTAAPGLDYFEQYYEPDDPLIFIKKGGQKYQFHYGTSQFMDSNDVELDFDDAMEFHDAISKTDIPNKYPKIGEFLEVTLGISTTMDDTTIQKMSDEYTLGGEQQ